MPPLRIRRSSRYLPAIKSPGAGSRRNGSLSGSSTSEKGELFGPLPGEEEDGREGREEGGERFKGWGLVIVLSAFGRRMSRGPIERQ
ncbi:MAG: hypothetical protein HUU21_11830 [Polyangiaceae bacterium]|nr:hypothetical protein [Polyangiaceae bacterium]